SRFDFGNASGTDSRRVPWDHCTVGDRRRRCSEDRRAESSSNSLAARPDVQPAHGPAPTSQARAPDRRRTDGGRRTDSVAAGELQGRHGSPPANPSRHRAAAWRARAIWIPETTPVAPGKRGAKTRRPRVAYGFSARAGPRETGRHFAELGPYPRQIAALV